MQMLPAIQPNAPAAAVRLDKASEPTSEGGFQSVLNQESGKTDKAESKPLGKQSEGKASKRKASDLSTTTDKQSDAASDQIPILQAQALTAAQSIVPPVAVPGPESVKLTLTDSALDTPAASALDAPSALGLPTEQADLKLPFEKAAGPAMPLSTSSQQPGEQLLNPLTKAAVYAQTQTNQGEQQVATTQNPQLAMATTGTLIPGTTSPKVKSEPLGDHRFAQLLGRNDTSASSTPADEPSVTMTETVESSVLGLNNIAGMNQAGQAIAAANPESVMPNTPGKEIFKGGNRIEAVVRKTEPANPATSNIDLFTGKEINPAQALDQVPQPTNLEFENLTSGSSEVATGIIEGNGQPPVMGQLLTPASSPAPTQGAQATTLQQNPGFLVPEQDIMEQVIQRSSLRELEGKRQLTVELHPEDLGQVKLKLIQEKDTLQLHLQAQSSEVRDLLEKHLPRLQEALQQQGLRLETIQVSVDAQRNNAQGFFERQQQQAQRNPWQQTNRSSLQPEEQHRPIQPNMPSSAKGLSLRI